MRLVSSQRRYHHCQSILSVSLGYSSIPFWCSIPPFHSTDCRQPWQIHIKQTHHLHSYGVIWKPALYISKHNVIWELLDLLLSMPVQCGHLILPKILFTELKWSKGEPLDSYNNYCYSASVSSMLESLGWPALQARRNYLKLLYYIL